MSDILCANPDCDRRAADGLNLCHRELRYLHDDPLEAVTLHAELGLTLTRASDQEERFSRNPHPGINLNEPAVEARAAIRNLLTTLTRLVVEERGFEPPANQLHHIGQYVALHAEWYAAHPAAADHSTSLRAIVMDGRRIAYPNGTRVLVLCPCPAVAEDLTPCEGMLRAVMRRADSLLPSSVACDGPEPHVWTADQWRQLGRMVGMRDGRWLTAEEIAIRLTRPLSSVYRLASTDRWERSGDGRKPVLYSAEDVEKTRTRLQEAA